MSKTPSRDAHSGYVGAGCELNGRLHAPGPFHVNGVFHGEILSEDVVSVGKGGAFEGTVCARRVVVEGGGRITGEIEADEVEVGPGGSIVGVAVRTASLSLAPGGSADGARFHVRRDFRRRRAGDGEAGPTRPDRAGPERGQPNREGTEPARAKSGDDSFAEPGGAEPGP